MMKSIRTNMVLMCNIGLHRPVEITRRTVKFIIAWKCKKIVIFHENNDSSWKTGIFSYFFLFSTDFLHFSWRLWFFTRNCAFSTTKLWFFTSYFEFLRKVLIFHENSWLFTKTMIFYGKSWLPRKKSYIHKIETRKMWKTTCCHLSTKSNTSERLVVPIFNWGHTSHYSVILTEKFQSRTHRSIIRRWRWMICACLLIRMTDRCIAVTIIICGIIGGCIDWYASITMHRAIHDLWWGYWHIIFEYWIIWAHRRLTKR